MIDSSDRNFFYFFQLLPIKLCFSLSFFPSHTHTTCGTGIGILDILFISFILLFILLIVSFLLLYPPSCCSISFYYTVANIF